jgi:hypothetical protein
VPLLSKRTLLLATLTMLGAAALAQSAAAPAPKLQPYTTPDKSASAGLPPGWKVTNGSQTNIIMNGPQNEVINLGYTAIARNAPFQLGQKGGGGADVSIPNSASLSDKLTMVFENTAAVSGNPAPQVKIVSETPIQVPASVGQCGRIRATLDGKLGLVTLAALMCSLPVDSGGTYKIMFKMAQAPPDIAQQEAALAGAVFASYRIPPNMLQMKLAPFYVPPAVAAAQTKAILAATAASQHASDVSANCFDLTVLRETPQYLLPRSCGGPRPG